MTTWPAPSPTCADTLERLVKSPDRFSIKTFHADGDRAVLLDRLRQLSEQRTGTGGRTSRSKLRNSTVLDVAAPLITAAAALPVYTRKTTSLAADTVAVRSALLTSREPSTRPPGRPAGLPPVRGPGRVRA